MNAIFEIYLYHYLVILRQSALVYTHTFRRLELGHIFVSNLELEPGVACAIRYV